eukprot:jgi/Tetstr1/434876/TSEL_023873.t1
MESESIEMRNRLLDASRVADSSGAAMSQLQHATSGASEAFSGAGSPPRVGSAEYASPRYLRRVECTPSGHEMSIDFDAEWESDVCAVCLTTVESLEEAGRLPCTCTAIYHRDCVARWLLRNNSCPLCRETAKLPRHLFPACDWPHVAAAGLWDVGGSRADLELAHSTPIKSAKGSAQYSSGVRLENNASHTVLSMDLDEVAVMFHCDPPFEEAGAMHLPSNIGFRDTNADMAEIWMRLQDMGAQPAVIALSAPPSTNSGASSLYRGLVALKGAWILSQAPSFMTTYHSDCLQSQEYTAATGVVWRVLDADPPSPQPPPYIVHRAFLLFVGAQQALLSFGRWMRCLSGSRTFIYLILIVLILLTIVLGIHQVCMEVSGGMKCTWAYQDTLMRRAIFYSSYR